MVTLIFLITGLILLSGSAIFFYKMSWKAAHLVILFAGLFIITFLPGNESLTFVISLVIIGLTAGYTFRNNKKLQFFIFVSSLTVTFIFTFNHYYLKSFKNIDILNISKDRLVDLLNENKVSDSEKNQVIHSVDKSIYLIRDILPFAYFLNSLILSFIGLYYLKFIFRKFADSKREQGGFLKLNKAESHDNKGEDSPDSIEKFKIKEYLIFIFIGCWFIVLLVDKTEYYFLYIAGLNIALILSGFYLIQAMGIIKFLFVKKGMPFFIVPGIMLSFLFLGIEYFLFILVILAGIGAIDFWADFRKLNMDTKNI